MCSGKVLNGYAKLISTNRYVNKNNNNNNNNDRDSNESPDNRAWSHKRTQGAAVIQRIRQVSHVKRSKDWIRSPSCRLKHLGDRSVLQKEHRSRKPVNTVSQGRSVLPKSVSINDHPAQEKGQCILRKRMDRAPRRYR